jgi:hypothetical protein
LFAILHNLGSNSCQDHCKLQKCQANVTIDKLDLIVHWAVSGVEVISAVEHGLLLIGVQGWNHFGNGLKELSGRDELWGDF